MRSLLSGLMAVLLPASLIALPSLAIANLAPDDQIAIEARGKVDLDGPGPLPALSNLIQTETIEPFTRSVVSVGDSAVGSFAYSASADVGTLALRVFGELNNPGAAALFGSGVPLLSTVAEARDVLVLSTGRTDPFDVRFELEIDGLLTVGSSSSASANSLLALGVEGEPFEEVDSGRYLGGIVDDTLVVTKTVSGPVVTLFLESLLSFNVTRLEAGESATGDLSNTATLRVILPPDVTIVSSGSGTFGVPIPIPEPGTYAMMLLGLMAIGGALSRARTRR